MAVRDGRVGDPRRRHLLHGGRRLAAPAHPAHSEERAPAAPEGAQVAAPDRASPQDVEGAVAGGGGAPGGRRGGCGGGAGGGAVGRAGQTRGVEAEEAQVLGGGGGRVQVGEGERATAAAEGRPPEGAPVQGQPL